MRCSMNWPAVRERREGFMAQVPITPLGFRVTEDNKERYSLTRVKPDIMMLAEASKPDLLLKAFDADYSWPLHGMLNKVLLTGAPASEFKRSWDESRQQFPRGSLHMRISDNHDEARAVARFSIKGALAASALMFSLDSVPLL